ncbi:hypothetical protein ACQR3P_06910 [Rhodococcus sp. IEGM1300]
MVSNTVEYDSNPALLTSGSKGVTRAIVAPDYTLVGTSGLDALTLGLGVNVVHSSDTSVVSNRQDPKLRFGWERQTETGAYGINAKYEESSTLSSAVQETGVVATDGTQKEYSLGGNWRTALNERNTLENNTDYKSVSYDVNTLTNYDELSNETSLIYSWSERVDLFTRFGVKRYEPESGTTIASSNSYTPTVGMNFEVSEQLKGSVYVGVNKVTGTDSGPGGEGGFELHYLGERFDASIDGGRTTIASGDGGLVEADNLKGAFSYAFDETRSAGFLASWQKTKGLTPNTLRNVGAWFSQELSPFWVARLTYTYKQRQQDGLPDATANVVGLTLIYSYPEL